MNTLLKSIPDLPGPKGLPLVGNLLQLDLNQFHLVMERWSNEFGTMFTFRLRTWPVAAVAEPELIQEILKHRPKRYRRLEKMETVFRELGFHGVFSAEGEDWERQRKLTARALDTAHLRAFFPVLRTVTERLRRRWEREGDVIQQHLERIFPMLNRRINAPFA